MYKRVTHLTLTIKLFSKLVVIASTALLFCVAEAADQGKLGTSSSGSVEISVYVNQTFDTVSPNELLLNKVLKTNSTEPFCVAHHGFNKDANVPYALIVDNLQLANDEESKQVMPYKVFLEDENTRNSKQQLTQGVSISTQSNLRLNKDMRNACINSGLQLSIEENNLEQNILTGKSSVGIMVLLISPT